MADKKQKILILDDSEMNRDILAVMLGSDYEILEAENGLEAIEILQQGMTDIDLILLDIMMPEMDGFDVLGFMKRSHMTEVIPVIMISSESSSSSSLTSICDTVLTTAFSASSVFLSFFDKAASSLGMYLKRLIKKEMKISTANTTARQITVLIPASEIALQIIIHVTSY